MIIRDMKVNDVNFRFVCESWSNSRGWGHRVVLFKNGIEINEAKIKYQNRTWECYVYQSCMEKAVRQLLEERKVDVIANYKRVNDLSRLSQKKKDEIIDNDEIVSTYRMLEKEIDNYNCKWGQ